MSIIWDQPQYSVLLGSFDTVRNWALLRDNKIGVVQNTADSVRYKQDPKIKYMDCLDMNKVVENKKLSELVESIRRFDEECLLKRHEYGQNSLIHCAKGANRTGAYACAFITAKTGESVERTYDFLRAVRCIVEIETCRHGHFVSPLGWLKKIEPDLHKIFQAKCFSVWLSKTILLAPALR